MDSCQFRPTTANTLKILQIASHDVTGGAARAGYRLHQGLQQIGQDSLLVVRHKHSNDASVKAITGTEIGTEIGATVMGDRHLWEIQTHYINANRTPLSNTLFSYPYPHINLANLPLVHAADVINLHWVSFFQSPDTLRALLALNKPVVWTLHDMWAFTGGCHYSAGCQGYQHNCHACPQLAEDPFQLPATLLRDKQEKLAAFKNLTVVTPSQWLADAARRSQLFQQHRIEVIPYGLDTEVFVPLPKADAKAKLGLPADTFTILFGCENGNEQRKGFAQLLQALQLCLQDTEIQKILEPGDRLRILCFGNPHADLDTLGIPVLSLGYTESDHQLSHYYAAANVCVLPSLEDNLPNIMLEAMSCGTPLIAFATGGIPDLVRPGQTGELVPVGDVAQLAAALRNSILQPERLAACEAQCRQAIVQNHTLVHQAQRYLDLYQTLLDLPSLPAPAVAPPMRTAGPSIAAPWLPLAPALQPVALHAVAQALHAERRTSQELRETLHAVSQQAQQHQQQQQNTIDQVKTALQQAQTDLHQTQTDLHQTQADLQHAHGVVASMERSKFWKLRTLWFKLRQFIKRLIRFRDGSLD